MAGEQVVIAFLFVVYTAIVFALFMIPFMVLAMVVFGVFVATVNVIVKVVEKWVLR